MEQYRQMLTDKTDGKYQRNAAFSVLPMIAEIDAVITSWFLLVSVSIIEQDYFFSNDHNLAATDYSHILSVLSKTMIKSGISWRYSGKSIHVAIVQTK